MSSSCTEITTDIPIALIVTRQPAHYIPPTHLLRRIQKQLARRLPPLQILMRPRNITKRIRLMNLDIHLILNNKPKQLLRIPLKLLPRHNKIKQRRPHQPHILRAQPRNRKRRHSTRSITKTEQTALPRQTVQRQVESRFPDAVENGDNAFAARQLITWLAPALLARSTFSCVLAVPIVLAPTAFSN
jgi:hypothetical protein